MGLLFGLLFFGAIVVVAALVLSDGDLSDLRRRVTATFASGHEKRGRAEEILRERLARGEIDPEEYERAARALRNYEA